MLLLFICAEVIGLFFRGEAGPGVMGKVARKFYGYDKLSNIKLKFQNGETTQKVIRLSNLLSYCNTRRE